MNELIFVGAGYLIGAIPFSYLAVRFLCGRDIRELGSGNAGATNVLRAAGPVTATVVLLLDVLKGAAPVLTAHALGASQGVVAATAVAAVFGHVFPAYIGFRGGKGVATAIGTQAALSLLPMLLSVALMLGVIGWKRYVSLGSIVGIGCAPLLFAGTGRPLSFCAAAAAIALLVVWRHRDNIGRLRAGTERRLGERLEVTK